MVWEAVKDTVTMPALFVIERLARENLFFTKVSEGTSKVITRGGRAHKILIVWKGKVIAAKDIYVEEEKNEKEKERKRIYRFGDVVDVKDAKASTQKEIFDENGERIYKFGDAFEGDDSWHPLGGIRWIGIPILNKVYVYPFQWRGLDLLGNPQELRGEDLDYILLKADVYFGEVLAAETGGEQEWVPIDVGYTVTAQVVNVFDALFGIQNWLEALLGWIAPIVNDIIAAETYESLTERTEFTRNMIKRMNELIYTPIQQVEERQPLTQSRGGALVSQKGQTFIEYVRQRIGVAVTDFKINQVSISSSVASDSLAAKSLQKFLNKVEARGVVEKAKGERKKTIIEALAEKQRIKMVVQAWKENGDLGTLIRTLEAMERSTAAFQYAIHDIPGLGELLERIGYPAKQTITRAELIEALKEIVGVKQNKED